MAEQRALTIEERLELLRAWASSLANTAGSALAEVKSPPDGCSVESVVRWQRQVLGECLTEVDAAVKLIREYLGALAEPVARGAN
jgi:hypothetical protein